MLACQQLLQLHHIQRYCFTLHSSLEKPKISINNNFNVLQAWELWSEERPLELVDESLGDSIIQAQVLRCIHKGLLCMQERPKNRPNMSSVIHMLNGDKPYPSRGYQHFIHTKKILPPINNEVCSKNEVTISLLEARWHHIVVQVNRRVNNTRLI